MQRVFSSAVSQWLAAAAFNVMWLGLCQTAMAFNSGSTGADGALSPAVNVQIQLPPSGVLNYTTINVPSGVTVTFKRNALNTPVVLLASGNVTVAGVIDVSGTEGAAIGTAGDGNLADDGLPGLGGPGGFDGGRGGAADPAQRPSLVDGGAGQGPGGGQGGRVPTGTPYSSPNGNSCRDNRVNGWEVYGLGAGFASPGPDANFVAYRCLGQTPGAPGYGSERLQPLIGGSGGGGGRGAASVAGAGGGGGGGAILIAATGSVTVSGRVVADGGRSGMFQGNPGGGGSGGSVYIAATTIAGNGQVFARGAGAQNVNGSCTPCSPSVDFGSPGRVRFAADNITFSGSTSPLFVSDVPSAFDFGAAPTVRFTTVAGVAVPAQPTGAGDIALPGTLTNPVTVTLATTGIPLGSTIRLRVVPAQGLPIEAISSAVAGTLANGTASGTVALPQGPSRLEAMSSFPVTVAMGESLSRFAGNEAVRSVEILATPGLTTRALLVTTSGRRHEVPADVLRIAGLGG